MAGTGTSKRSSPAAASLSQQAVESANRHIDARMEELRTEVDRKLGMGGQPQLDDVIINPNGQQVHIAQFADNDFIAEDHSSMFATDPNTYLVAPNPECLYVWPAKNDPRLFARLRAGQYRPVETSELREDCILPITTHTVPGITKIVKNEDGTETEMPRRLVACYDVILMEVQPRAVKQLYRWPAFQAALRTRAQLPFQQLKKRLEEGTGGKVTAQMTMRSD